MTIRDLSVYDGLDYDSTVSGAGDGVGSEYVYWDKQSLMMCNCDNGYTGPDCSLSVCPRGDDPLTLNQNIREVLLTVTSATYAYGVLGIEFHGETIWISLSDPSSKNCTETFRAAKDVFGQVVCTFTRRGNEVQLYNIKFVKWPLYPKENNLYFHNGNPKVTDFLCDITLAKADITCGFTDVQASNIVEHLPCSNRGICDSSSGRCNCYDGYNGPACNSLAYLQNKPVSVFVNPWDYLGTVMDIEAPSMTNSSDFYWLETVASTERVFFVRGDGAVGGSGLGIVVQNDGVVVPPGGLTITSGGLSVTQLSPNSPVIEVQSSSTTQDPTDVLQVTSSAPASLNNYLIMAQNKATTKFSVRDDGLVNVAGGLLVTGGLSVSSNGLMVLTSALTLNSGGMKVNGGITDSWEGLLVAYGGMTILNTGGTAPYGLVVNRGATVTNWGVNVSSGGETVAQGGMTLWGGLSVQFIGLTITGGMSVQDTGLQVTGGFTGLTYGMTLTDGMTVSSGSLTVTGSITILGYQVSPQAPWARSQSMYLNVDTERSFPVSKRTGQDLSISAGSAFVTTPRGTGGRLLLLSGYSATSSSGSLVLSTANAGLSGSSGLIVLSTGSCSR